MRRPQARRSGLTGTGGQVSPPMEGSTSPTPPDPSVLRKIRDTTAATVTTSARRAINRRAVRIPRYAFAEKIVRICVARSTRCPTLAVLVMTISACPWTRTRVVIVLRPGADTVK